MKKVELRKKSERRAAVWRWIAMGMSLVAVVVATSATQADQIIRSASGLRLLLGGVPQNANAVNFNTNLSGSVSGGVLTINASGGGPGSLPVVDSTSIVEGSGDNTKEMRIEVDTNVATGTVRVLTMANQNIDLTPNTGTYPAKVAASADNMIIRADGTSGAMQESSVTINDSGDIVMAAVGDLVDGRDVSVDGAKLDGLPTTAYSTIGDDGASQTARARLNGISGTGVNWVCADNGGTNSTDCTMSVDTADALDWSATQTFSNAVPVVLSQSALPAAAATTTLRLSNAVFANSAQLVMTNLDWQRPLIPDFGRRRMTWIPIASGAAGFAGELTGFTLGGVGTNTHPAIATTNYGTSQVRSRRTATATSQNTFCNFTTASTDAGLWRGNASGLGGFFAVFQFMQSVATDADAAFVGLTTNITPANGAPASTEGFGICYEAADTIAGVPNWQSCRNDNAGAGTKATLGANCPRDTSTVIEVMIYAAPNGSEIGLRAKNLTTNTICLETSYNTDLPRSSVFMLPWSGQQNGTGGVACAHDLIYWDILVGS